MGAARLKPRELDIVHPDLSDAVVASFTAYLRRENYDGLFWRAQQRTQERDRVLQTLPTKRIWDPYRVHPTIREFLELK
jgi:hypothetical protein